MKTILISSFPGCGKTYLYNNQGQLGYSILDIDSGSFKRDGGWVSRYVDDIEKMIGKVDFILISQHDEVLSELNKRHIRFFTVAPNSSDNITPRCKELIKQQWFGRFILRDNSHIDDFKSWMEKINCNYETWTNKDYLLSFNPLCHFALNEDQYLEDIIKDIIAFTNNHSI